MPKCNLGITAFTTDESLGFTENCCGDAVCFMWVSLITILPVIVMPLKSKDDATGKERIYAYGIYKMHKRSRVFATKIGHKSAKCFRHSSI